jgi:uncharacterized protein YbjT (DUF2867 family)
MQESLFWFGEDIKHNRRLQLPIKDEKFAPLNLHDLTFVVKHLLVEGGIRQMARGQIYRLTGSELVTGRNLAERLTKLVGREIKYEAVDRKHTEEWLRGRLLNDMMLQEVMDIFELISRGKLNFVSDDEKKTTGRAPVTVDSWLNQNKSRFMPLE